MIKNFIIDNITQADQFVNALLYGLRNNIIIKIFGFITLFGESWVIILCVLATSVFLFLKNKKWQIMGLMLAVIGSIGFTYLLKLIFNRPRPINAIFLETSASFPSGHATIAVSFYGFIAYLIIKKVNEKKYRVPVILSGIIIALLIGFSRLYLGVHYLSDVLAGYLIGLLWLIISLKLITRNS